MSYMLIMFANKVVLITGASSGIGAQTAIDFSQLEADVVIVGRNKDRLDNVAKQCKEISPKKLMPLTIIADISKEVDVEKVIKTTIIHYNKLDVLVNNAGIVFPETIETTTLQQYDTLMNTNIRGPYYLTMLSTPHLIKTKGTIINVSSVAGLRSFPGILSYSISKAAMDQFTRCVALELASKGVRVNSVNPGDIETGIHHQIYKTKETYDEYMRKRCQEIHPIGRHGEVKEVSSVIIFLASDAASNVTGVTLPVDGGRQLMCPR